MVRVRVRVRVRVGVRVSVGVRVRVRVRARARVRVRVGLGLEARVECLGRSAPVRERGGAGMKGAITGEPALRHGQCVDAAAAEDAAAVAEMRGGHADAARRAVEP